MPDLSKLPKAMALALTVLGISAIPVASSMFLGGNSRIPVWLQLSLFLLGAVSAVLIFSALIGRHHYRIVGRHLVLGSLGGAQKIALRDIIGVSKLKRSSSEKGTREQVKVTFRRKSADADEIISLVPKAPAEFVHQLVARCPQLSEYDQGRLIKTGGLEITSEPEA